MIGPVLLASIQPATNSGAPAIEMAALGVFEFTVMAMVIGIGGSLLFPLVKAFARRMEGGGAPAAIPKDLGARLDRIERGIEAIAEEVERVSENQRFVTQLMSKREGQPALGGGDKPFQA